MNIPDPLIHSISYLLKSHTKLKTQIKDMKAVVDRNQALNEREKLAIHQKLEKKFEALPAASDGSVIDMCTSAITYAKKQMSEKVSKQGLRIDSAVSNLEGSINRLAAEHGKNLADSRRGFLQYVDGKVGAL